MRVKATIAAVATALIVAWAGPADAAVLFVHKWGSAGISNGQFVNPQGVAVGAGGDIYVADSENHRIQRFDTNGNFLAKWGSNGTGDGQFNVAAGIAAAANGDVYVADMGNHRIQKFDANGNFLTKWGSLGTAAGQLAQPRGVAVDGAGNVYVVETTNDRVQKFDSDGGFITKWGKNGGDGTNGSGNGEFTAPQGIAVDAAGNVYVADTGNHRVQKFDSSGNYLAKWGTPGTGNGQMINPFGLAVDTAGNVYLADQNNHRIQKFDSGGTFLAKWGKNGGDGTSGSGDGEFEFPAGIEVDTAGNVYVVEYGNDRVQKFAQFGSVTIVKDAVPNDAQDFLYTVGTTPFLLDDDSDPALANTVTFGGLSGGFYTFTEGAVAGWDLTGLSCTTGETVDMANRRVIVNLGPGEETTCTYTSTKQVQPDGEIKKKNETSYLGLGVLNNDGTGQAKSQTKPAGKTAKFDVRVHNSSVNTDSIEVSGPTGGAGFKVRYFQSGVNITGAVTGGGHTLSNLAPGAFQQLRIEVKVKSSTPPTSVQDVLLTAASTGIPAQLDAVKATVTST